ncbi:MAG: type I glyceraldehyde-3-phosphate dehydrogenase [Salibacteraceae bacterium]
MDTINIAINGFGRIGRTLTRVLYNHPQIKIKAVNDLADAPTLAHLLKYDTIHGKFPGEIESREKCFFIDDKVIQVYNQKSPETLPWSEFGIDVVVEATGKFRTTELASLHLRAGAKKVILSAPSQDSTTPSVVLGINDDVISPSDLVVSNASCTTNSAAPLIKILMENWGIDQAYITTVHSYTSDQRLHDAPHNDWRRARAAAQSIVPTTTGAAKAITRIFPELDGRIGGAGIRVPVPNGSLTDLSCIIEKRATIEEINEAFKNAAEGELKGILEYTEDPIVSVDIIGNPHSCIFDAQLTSVLGKMVKVVGWYDNEWGYCNRLAELILKIA